MFARRQLQAFISVAELGSFTRAADRVHLSQPALSSSIRKLETLLGLSLFARDTRGVSLTPAGRHFLEHARRILAEMEQALDDAHSMAHLQRGLIRIAALPSVASSCLPRLTQAFLTRHPHVDLDIRDGLARAVQEWVNDGEVDIALTSRPEHEGLLNFTPLWQDELIAVTPRANGTQSPDWRRQLGELPYIALTPDTSIRPLADRALQAANMATSPAWEIAQMSSAIAMVRERLGYTLLPASCIEVFNLGSEVQTCPVPGIARELGILLRRPLQQSPALEAFMTLLQETFQPASAASSMRSDSAHASGVSTASINS
ncbi:LysR family transcriptional regulator [Kushneria phosphatilytica]|uniref:LysR family transcriptional regulator n=1 Tax=Kushneria phosphatilytica TaxID=657387 RepID=A0A1S1NMQ9_9GAMM|nr:LysR family transcriptional regulator [Kushneria phosphatilytica]OHV08445.1 hypothetical protein BH688_14175 [Kushneria phosphatilytica]QEL09873.1 LysR family transcriptional regulator [Kushneria phosphatilytica]